MTPSDAKLFCHVVYAGAMKVKVAGREDIPWASCFEGRFQEPLDGTSE